MIFTDLYNNKNYLYEGLDIANIRSVKLWESAGRKLVEYQMSPAQITQMFGDIEKSATTAGSNRTMVGQGKDAAVAVNRAWEDLKTKVQNSGPIKNVDAMYDQAAEKLKKATGGDQGVMQYVQKYRDFAKKHPIAQSLIYSALIAAAGISGAGVGGAAALGLLKMTDKLLQGEKFSSAAYSGAKTGGMAYAAGQIGKALKGGDQAPAADSNSVPATTGSAPVSGEQVTIGGQTYQTVHPSADFPGRTYLKIPGMPGAKISPDQMADLQKVYAQSGGKMISKGAHLWYQTPDGPGMLDAGSLGMHPDELLKVLQKSAGSTAKSAVQSAATNTATDVATQAAGSAIDNAQTLTASQMSAIDKALAAGKKLSPSLQASYDLTKGDAGNRLGAMTSNWYGDSSAVKESIAVGGIVLTNEGITDMFKTAAGKVGQWAQNKGHNLTTKVTSDKLQSAWRKAGAPTDSDAVYSVILSQGVAPEVADSVYKSFKIQTPSQTTQSSMDAGGAGASVPSTVTNPATGKLYTKAELRAKYGDQAPTTNAVAPATAATAKAKTTRTVKATAPAKTAGPTAGANAFSQMTRQLSQPASSTGGTTTATATGLRHTASATNPNQPSAATTPAATPATAGDAGAFGQIAQQASASKPVWTGREKSAPVAAAKITPKMPAAPAAPKVAGMTPEPITIGKQVIKPSDPNYAKIMKKTAVAESQLTWSRGFDPSASLLRRMKRS
jgi:hypothetical protein